MDDRWLSVEAIAEYLGVSEDAMYWRPSSKGTPSHRVGRFSTLKRDEVDEWVRTDGADMPATSNVTERGKITSHRTAERSRFAPGAEENPTQRVCNG